MCFELFDLFLIHSDKFFELNRRPFLGLTGPLHEVVHELPPVALLHGDHVFELVTVQEQVAPDALVVDVVLVKAGGCVGSGDEVPSVGAIEGGRDATGDAGGSVAPTAVS